MAEQEFVIVPPSDTDVSAMALRTDVQFLDPYGSESINRKFFGIIPPGIYRGFKYALPGAMKLRIGLPNEPGTAVAQCNSVCITVQQTKPVDLTVAAGFSGLVVLTGFYQFGVPTKQVSTTSTQDAAKIELIAASALKPNQVILYTVNVPAGTTALTSAMITTARRQDVSIAVEADIYQMLTDHIGSPTAHTKAQVGLSLVNNWGATAAVNDASDAKYATAGAVKKAYDLASAALPKAGGVVGAIKVQAASTHLTLAGPKGENPWHFEVNAANGDFKLVETGAASRFSLAKGGAATFASHVTASQVYSSAAQSTATNALTRRDFVLKWSEDNSRQDALKQAGAYVGGAVKTDFNLLDVGANGLYSSGPEGDKSVNMPPQEAWGGSWVGLEVQRIFNSDMLQTTLPFADAKTISFRTRRTEAFGEWISLYSTAFKPTKGDVGLGSVNNWGATAAVNDPSNAKYATAGAVKTTYDFATKLKADLEYQLNTEYRLTINRPGGPNYPYITLNKAELRTGQDVSYGVGALQFNAGPLSDPNNPDSGKQVASVFGMLDKTNEFGELLLRTKRLSNNSDTTWLKLNQDGLTLRSGGKELRVSPDGAVTASNQITTINPKDANAIFSLCFINDVATVRYGGTGTGSSNGFQVAGVGDDVKFSVGNDKTVTIYNKLLGGNFTGIANKQLLNHNASGTVYLGNPEVPGVNIETATGIANVLAGGISHRIYHKGYNPTKADVGLGNLQNWGITGAVNDPSDAKYATAGAVKKAYDLAAAALPLTGGGVVSGEVKFSDRIHVGDYSGQTNKLGANSITMGDGDTGFKWVADGNIEFWSNNTRRGGWSATGVFEWVGDMTAQSLKTTKEIQTTSVHSFRQVYGNYGSFWRQDGSSLYLMLTASGDQYGTYTAARPLIVNLATGLCTINGNAATATKLATARQINGTNFDGTANITTAKWGATRTLTIGNAGKSVSGGENVAWSLAEIETARALGEISSGAAANITTAEFVQWLKDSGAFNERVWTARGSWSYANNKTITDTGCGNIHLSGCTIEVISSHEGAYTVRIITPTTTSGGGTTGAEYVYVNNGSTYAPGWRRIFTTAFTPTKAEVGLGNLQNWGVTGAVNDASDAKYATAGAVKKAYDLAATKLGATANAVSATKLATARQINGTNFDGTGNITTANWGTARTLTIGNAGKSVNGAGNVAWTLAEIGALPSSSYSPRSDSLNNSAGVILAIEAGDLNTRPAGDFALFNGVKVANSPHKSSYFYCETKSIYSTGALLQTAWPYDGVGGVYHRNYSLNSHAWSPWRLVYDTVNKPTAADVGLGNVVNKGWNTGPAPDTYAVRDAAADLQARLFRATYANQSDCSGAIAFRVNNTTDNYTRYCSNPTAVRNWINSDITSAGGWGQVGTYMYAAIVYDQGQAGVGGLKAGSLLRPSGSGEWSYDAGKPLPGTWKQMGSLLNMNNDDRWDDRSTLWLRVA